MDFYDAAAQVDPLFVYLMDVYGKVGDNPGLVSTAAFLMGVAGGLGSTMGPNYQPWGSVPPDFFLKGAANGYMKEGKVITRLRGPNLSILQDPTDPRKGWEIPWKEGGVMLPPTTGADYWDIYGPPFSASGAAGTAAGTITFVFTATTDTANGCADVACYPLMNPGTGFPVEAPPHYWKPQP